MRASQLRAGAEPDEIVGRFRRLVHVLLVFARHLKRCELRGPDGREEVSWSEQPVAGAGGVFVGELTPSSARPPRDARGALVVRAPAGDVLLPLGRRGFHGLAPDVPVVWVAAPTEEEADVGFAVNGPFDLDVGRSQLAIDPAAHTARPRGRGRRPSRSTRPRSGRGRAGGPSR